MTILSYSHNRLEEVFERFKLNIRHMIEEGYFEHIAQIEEVYGHEIEPTLKGEHVYKNTWLFAATYFWKQLRLVLKIDSDKEREARLDEIRKEFEDVNPSQMLTQFHQTCFPDAPVKILDATWKCSGRNMYSFALPLLGLPPGRKREILWGNVDQELLKLKTLWLIPPGDPSSN